MKGRRAHPRSRKLAVCNRHCARAMSKTHDALNVKVMLFRPPSVYLED